jgi:glyoxylase-like metal-dependent hydrolase (beta-lactamase superfamily II)
MRCLTAQAGSVPSLCPSGNTRSRGQPPHGTQTYRRRGRGRTIRLRYGNTNTYLIRGNRGNLLVDTDYAGTLPGFYKAIKPHGIRVRDIAYVLATHYHPDHMGLIPELMKQGVKLLLVDKQKDFVHFSDYIFARDGLPFAPIDETQATVISCEESRRFLAGIGISGEIIHTPSHSPDGISLILDSGECFVGDLEPFEYLDAYEKNDALKADWTRIRGFRPKQVFYAHAAPAE